jgi:methanethiol S-methyltransferase
MNYLFIAFLWAAYCALHSYLISKGFTNFISRKLKKYYAFYRIFYILISVALIIPLINYSAQQNSQIIIRYGSAMSVIRYIILSGSLLMFFWAFFVDYDALTFFGIRQLSGLWKGEQTEEPGEIKQKGLLGLMRHPMYFALIIYLWCNTFSVLDIIVNSVLTIYIFIGTWLEEKKLVLEFGDAYNRYRKEVPMIIPFTKMNHQSS